MSLATRCTSCGTIFRVVQDQLKVSEGWVRCGRCQEVFSALEGLFDLEREAPPQRIDAKPSATEKATDDVTDFVESHRGTATDFDPFTGEVSEELDRSAQALPSTHETDAIESRFLTHGRSPSAGPTAAEEADEEDGFYAARFQPDAADEVPAPAPAPPPPPASLAARWRASRESREAARASSMLEPAPDDPSVAVAEAEASAAGPGYLDTELSPPPQRPVEIAAWSAGAALLVVALLGQVAYQFRDVFAAQWPQSRGALATLCEWTGCKIEPLRRLAAVTVEDSGLTQVQGAEAYRLSVTLHNRSAFEVAVPSIDLSLTDGSGALVSRRALAPRDFAGAPTAAASGGAVTLAPGAEAQLQALLASRGARITGYTVELFYP